MKSTLLTKRNLFYLNIAIGIIVILSALLLIQDIISVSFEKDKTLKTERHASKDINAAQRKMQLIDYASILKNNPFGFPGGELNPISTAGIPISQSDVSLVGTVSGPRKMSYAIFMDKMGQQEVFRIGDSVFGIGILKSIERERVSVSAGGRDTVIPLADITTIKEIKSSGTKFTGEFARRTGDGTYLIDQRMVQRAIENPNEIMTDARLLPNIIDGSRQEGFVLREVRPGGIYQSLGLQNGDVILRINEYNISNPEAALQAFTALKGMDRIQLDIIRSGAKMTMTYQIR